MDKERYYVSVSAHTITTEPSMTDQLTVLATPRERDHLATLLQQEEQADDETHMRAIIPYKSADHDQATKHYNSNLLHIYKYIYKIGTTETKRHIEYMDIIRDLKNTDYDQPGYVH
ncbi:hypothetical protein E5161_12555 [Cohnella pontilimi]|uniref:Uncharacterized protein n=1 Tax=Cohnella pontilimi TaxID=2564100 RepID=A0A4U0FB25_9BACL|nr:hypothetical protein [Cohnella pontilimi]TJY42016.1 hypothetical protein E5161_12555 [Cohnella pontilimi]